MAGNTSDERLWLEWNARAQVTSWGSIESNGNTIADYASKQWGGLVGSYHLPLWRHFFTRMCPLQPPSFCITQTRMQTPDE